MTDYNNFKREVAFTLRKFLLGTTSKVVLNRRTIEVRVDKQKISDLMRELDKAFKEHGVDWKLDSI